MPRKWRDGRLDGLARIVEVVKAREILVHDLLRNPPAFRRAAGARALSSPSAQIAPTLSGLRATERAISRLDIFRNGNVEFVAEDSAYISYERRQTGERDLTPWAVAESIRNFTHFVERVRQVATITDPYLFTVSVWRCRGVRMAEEQATEVWGLREPSIFEGDDLLLEPIVAAADEAPDVTARRIADRFWNAFGYMACPFFDAEGQFVIR